MASSTRLPDPTTVLRSALDDARVAVARLEAENVGAIQEEEAALERGDTASIVAARSRALVVTDALARRRARVAELEAQLASLHTEPFPISSGDAA